MRDTHSTLAPSFQRFWCPPGPSRRTLLSVTAKLDRVLSAVRAGEVSGRALVAHSGLGRLVLLEMTVMENRQMNAAQLISELQVDPC